MNKEIPTIPKEVSEAIQKLRAYGMNNFGIIRAILQNDVHDFVRTLRSFAYNDGTDRTDVLLEALINGYTVEKEENEE